ncbi:hypothetical protein A2U01_0073237, partial [Trifolium medium]|nr:hypothetical protein [Trifolium medium]
VLTKRNLGPCFSLLMSQTPLNLNRRL